MRRQIRGFTVEHRRARRPGRVTAFEPDEDLVDTGVDELPSRDVHADLDEQPNLRAAEDAFYGGGDRGNRSRFQAAEALFKTREEPRETELPVDSTDIFPPLRTKTAESSEIAEAQKAEEPKKPRILQNLNYVDPLQTKIAEMEAERKARVSRAKTPREARPPRQQKASKAFSVAPEIEVTPETPQIEAVATPTQPLVLPRLKLRPRHKTPRILYNRWNYRLFKEEARHVPKSVASVILKPGQHWKRNLPTCLW